MKAGRPGHQRPVDDVAVARHPAGVGGTPVDVVGLDVEDELGGGVACGPDSRRGCGHALRLAGRAGGVEDEERVFGIHHLGFAMRAGDGQRHQIVAPVSRGPAPCGHACPVRLTTITRSTMGSVRPLRRRCPSGSTVLPRSQAPSLVMSDFALGVVDAVSKRLRR